MDVGFHRAGVADDAGARVLLRRAGSPEERAQHDDDEFHLARIRRRRCGRSSATRWRSRPATTGSAMPRASLLRGVGLEAQGTIPHLLFMCYQGDVLHHHGRADLRRHRRAHAVLRRTSRSSRSGRSSSTAPIAHWVWGGGFLAKMGALDFAGGTVVHVNAAARRAGRGARRRPAARLPEGRRSLPHNVPFTLLGAGLLWFGWFGFNAGSALAANGIAALAFTATMLAPAGTLVVWTLLDMSRTAEADRRRRRHRHRRRAGGDHAGGRLRRADERHRARRDRRIPQLLRVCSGGRRPRSTTRSTSSPRTASAAPSARCSRASSRRRRSTASPTACCSAIPRQLGIQAMAVAAAIVYSGVMSFVLLKAGRRRASRCAPMSRRERRARPRDARRRSLCARAAAWTPR